MIPGKFIHLPSHWTGTGMSRWYSELTKMGYLSFQEDKSLLLFEKQSFLTPKNERTKIMDKNSFLETNIPSKKMSLSVLGKW